MTHQTFNILAGLSHRCLSLVKTCYHIFNDYGSVIVSTSHPSSTYLSYDCFSPHQNPILLISPSSKNQQPFHRLSKIQNGEMPCNMKLQPFKLIIHGHLCLCPSTNASLDVNESTKSSSILIELLRGTKRASLPKGIAKLKVWIT